MKFKTLQWIGLALVMTLAAGHSAEDPVYWKEFEAKGIPLIQHIQNLSAISDTATAGQKEHTKNALAYFFATGGKFGFRKEPATALEYNILVKALAVTTTLHDAASTFDLVAVRRGYGLTTEDQRTQNHLIQAQAIIAHALWMPSYFDPGSTEFTAQLQDHTKNDYVAPLQKLSTKPSTEYLKSAFIDVLTMPVVQEIVRVVSPTFGGKIDGNCLNGINQIVEMNFHLRNARSNVQREQPAQASSQFRRGGSPNICNQQKCMRDPSALGQPPTNSQDDGQEKESEPSDYDW